MPWTALSARSSCCCLWFPSLQCSRASMGWGGPTWLHLLFTAGSLDSGACDADYGFLALHLPLGDHVLIYADITVAPSFPLWLHPGGVPPSGCSRIHNILWIWQLAESKEMTVGLWQCETVRLWHGSRACGPFGCGSVRLWHGSRVPDANHPTPAHDQSLQLTTVNTSCALCFRLTVHEACGELDWSLHIIPHLTYQPQCTGGIVK